MPSDLDDDAQESESNASYGFEFAPVYDIPRRHIVALEHPAIIQNIHRGIASFGSQPDFQRILDNNGFQSTVPLYLSYRNPTAGSIDSHNAASHNVLLKITVPKRTGRKRKRGSDGPWESEAVETGTDALLCLDDADGLKRKIRDNLDHHEVEVMGLIKQTHRYRSLADYQLRTNDSPFMNSFLENVVPGEISGFRNFRMSKGTAPPGNAQLIPPPRLTHHAVPFNYAYMSNPYDREVSQPGGEKTIINVTAPKGLAGIRINYNERTPTAPRRQPNLSSADVRAVMTEFDKAMAERPIWTRRSLINRLKPMKGSRHISDNLVKKCICYIGYQFQGGPWRDAIVKYGIDPRMDSKYRMYQTFIFRLQRTPMGETGQTWQQTRSEAGKAIKTGPNHDAPADSHIFDGKSISQDGKVWQVCDITDPLLAALFRDAAIRPTCDSFATGWFHQGFWAKCKGIMKCKIQAIVFNRSIPDSAYAAAVAGPDRTPILTASRGIRINLPNLHLTQQELATLAQRKYHSTGEVRDRRGPRPFHVYAHKRRKDREGDDVEGEVVGDEGEDVERLELDDAGPPDLSNSQGSADLLEEDVDLENESGGESDEDEGEYDDEIDGGLHPGGPEEEGEDSDMDSSESGSSSSEAGDSPEGARGLVHEAGYDGEEGEGDEDEYYSDEDEYDSDGAEVIEGEEFGGEYYYEEEGFRDETDQKY